MRRTQKGWIAAAATALVVLSVSTALGAAPQRPDTVMGEYQGKFESTAGKVAPAEANVIAVGNEKDGKKPYRVVLGARPVKEGDEGLRLRLEGNLVGQLLTLASDPKESEIPCEGTLTHQTLVVKAQGPKGGKFVLRRYERKSPTLGAKPPKGAIVLLPYEEGKRIDEEAYKKNWTNANWLTKPEEDAKHEIGSILVRKGGNFTTGKFGDCRLHLEFKCPYEPDREGQARGNSGVYLQGRYEVQVLDSFGLKPGMGDCGSIYGVAITKRNASLPPEQWQTYDITLRAPRFDASGNMTERPWMTVVHNGIEIHKKQEITKDFTTAAPRTDRGAPKDSLYLQDHGNPVRYRNIWLVEGLPPEGKF